MEADFSGYATVHGLKCSDGRTIDENAFKHMDGKKVPLVWSHQHNDVDNVLGYGILEHRTKGMYVYGYFNDTPRGKSAKGSVQHGDIEALSIFANKLKEQSRYVQHGEIREVSLVIAGANPGALIDNVYIRHSDDALPELVEDVAIIYTDEGIEHEQPKSGDDLQHAEGDEVVTSNKTFQDVINTFNDEQKAVFHAVIEEVAEKAIAVANGEGEEQDAAAEHSDGEENDDNTVQHNQEGSDMTRNVFDQTAEGGTGAKAGKTLSHSDVQSIMHSADKLGSLKEAVEQYAGDHLEHGINDIELLFPDFRALTSTPDFDSRRMEWVRNVLGGVHKSPFSRVKTIVADITQDEARAKGYIKGNMKKEEWFGLTKRTTGPTTVYKKQSLDRDDIVDITDFDVVVWMKGEMRLMLDEELARAILIGDGREVDDEDKIKDPAAASDGNGIRSILHDHELYATTVTANIDDAGSSNTELTDLILESLQYYKGSGSPTFYTTLPLVTKLLLTRDTLGRRLWKSKAELASELGVAAIVEVEVMADQEPDLIGILVNLTDYNVGADKGGEINFFDDFDIDFNKYKYLYETRISGGLTKIKSAIIVKKTAAANVLVAPTKPTFVESTGVVTIPTKTGVVYKNADTDATLTAGAQSALAEGATLNVLAVPAAGYYFKDNANDEWSFTRPTA